jgi:hypothetical protein
MFLETLFVMSCGIPFMSFLQAEENGAGIWQYAVRWEIHIEKSGFHFTIIEKVGWGDGHERR